MKRKKEKKNKTIENTNDKIINTNYFINNGEGKNISTNNYVKNNKNKYRKENEHRNNNQSIYSIIKYIIKFFKVLLYICIIYSIIFFVYSTITKKQYFSVFGISFFTMENNLMEEELNKNDLIIAKDNVRYNENLEVNDNIVYERNSQIKINKITKINQNNGKTEYVTKAIKNYHPESENVTNSEIIGKVIANIAVLGFLLKILQSKVMVFVFLLFLIIRLFYNKYQYKMKIERKKKKLKIS